MREKDEEKKPILDRVKRLDKEIEEAKKTGHSSAVPDFELERRNQMAKLTQPNSPVRMPQKEDLSPTELPPSDQEPFGQPIDYSNEEYDQSIAKQKDRMDRQVNQIPPSEPVKTSVPGTGPQAEASVAPSKDISAESLKPPKQKPPGGLARMRNIFQRGGKTAQNAGGTADKVTDGSARGGIRQAGKQLADRGFDALKKVSRQAIKKIVASLMANPYFWLIVGGIIATVILFVVALSFIGTINSKKPSPTGGTPAVLVNAKTDWSKVAQVLKLAGEETVTGAAIDDATGGIKPILDQEKLDNSANKNLVNLIDTAESNLEILQSSKTQENAAKFLTSMADYFNYIEDDTPVYTGGTTQFPVKSTSSLVFNSDLHGNSFLRPEAVDNNNVYITDTKGKEKCDAVDVSVSTADEASKNIYPIFGGEIIDVGDDGANGKRIAVKNGDYSVNYIHLLNTTKNKGDKVALTDPLGEVKTNHIQLEVMYQNKCLVTTHGDMINHATKDRKHESWGGYLWDRIVKTFNLK